MKGPIAPPRQQMIMENRTSLSPRPTATDESRTKSTGTSSSRSSRPKIVDPWSDGGTASSSPGRAANTTAAPPPPPPPPAVADPVPKRTPSNNVTKVIDLAPAPADTRSRNSSKGSKGTIDSNPAETSLVVPPGSPGTGRRHRFHDSSSAKSSERIINPSGLLPMISTGSPSIQRIVRDPIEQEQALFEQRLCEDTYGVAVRKINQYGKANLRYVKCLHVDDLTDTGSSKRSISSRSVSSKGRKRISLTPDYRKDPLSEKTRYALVWGKKKDVQITLDQFLSVRIGKATERAKRNPSPSSRILSLLTRDPKHSALDIEAPTRMDRDKFARAFSRFLDVPLEGDDSSSVHSAEFTPVTHKTTPEASASSSAPGDMTPANITTTIPLPKEEAPKEQAIEPKQEAPATAAPEKEKDIGGFWQGAVAAANAANQTANQEESPEGLNLRAVVELPSEKEFAADEDGKDNEGGSVVSSLTGHAYDQEIVEELHNALNDLRVQLEDSRMEAARAVKVAEQAIQSAAKNCSQEWQNTVTHKAAEAAAMAQKRSAEAMAKQRLAEERLDGERRTAAFWRKQAEVAEEEAGLLQTRAASAEVRKSGIEEQLESEKRMAQAQMNNLKARIAQLEAAQLDSLNMALQKNSDLETELGAAKRDLASKERPEDAESPENSQRNKSGRNSYFMGRKKKADKTIETASSKIIETKTLSSPDDSTKSPKSIQGTSIPSDELLKLKAETVLVRQQYENLRRSTTAELSTLPEMSKQWSSQVSGALEASQAEIKRLRERLSTESASRRKLLHEVQDLRGVVRVYCRPRPPQKDQSIFEMPSQETLVLRRDRFDKSKNLQPMSFEFDRIFDSNLPQQEVYGEIEEVCIGVLDGFNVTLMAFGQEGCGKTKSVIGDLREENGQVAIENHGIHLQSLRQLFDIAEHRSERFKDTFALSIVEVYNERLSDLLVGTSGGESKGSIIVADSSSRKKKDKQTEDDASSGKGSKLEIRSDLHGDTVVHGSLSVDVESFDEVVTTWSECLANRRKRLEEQGTDVEAYESSSHIIATLKVTSANIATGHGVVGKLQFVDMASAEVSRRRNSESNTEPKSSELSSSMIGSGEWRFKNRSLETLCDVVAARAQYVRNVPYRNSTLTHVLRDSLEGDTKVIFLACVSSDPTDIQESTATLKLASRMKQVTLGKATKHALTQP